jgi:hypothetical protein
MESLAINHAFMDGNKRVASVLPNCFQTKNRIIGTSGEGGRRADPSITERGRDGAARRGRRQDSLAPDIKNGRVKTGPGGAEPRNNLGSARSLTHGFGHPFFHFLGGNVFGVRGDRPHVAEGIDDGAGAVAVELILDGADELGA